MSVEPEQNAPKVAGTAGSNAAGLNTAGSKGSGSAAASKPRTGVPVWRTGKPDAVLAAAVDAARAAVESIAPAEQIGRHLGARTEGDRLVTHLFESKLAGYGGWQWYAVLTRNSRSKVVTVDELGLLPSEDSILAPEWVPWAERVRPEDAQDEESAEPAAAAEQAAAASDEDYVEADAAVVDNEEEDGGAAVVDDEEYGDAADEEYGDDADGNDYDANGNALPVRPAEEAD
ncbi:DUF3027 domain-containing protein [Pseudarthrobacter sp. MM222]|uniref:DUF3027 domain-containing protein n=1 Tax=Pseudarthrobacter sp. MM222 TaxID=3018929 RepID=UPI002220CB0F|nr:DUF3027 domain-containing protein [Pseudarthrobacter sp. MM222]CAI3793130.1 hypothetical protein NKCBBBOE_00728 [Pseudarthrobacter sp. MM222]